MVLHSDKESAPGHAHRFHQPAVRRKPLQAKPLGRQDVPEGVVELVAVAVAFRNAFRSVNASQHAAVREPALVCAEAHRAALGDVALLVGHEVDDLAAPIGKFARTRVRNACRVPGILYHRSLHSEAYPEIGNVVFARIFRCKDLTLHAAFAETAGHENAVRPLQQLLRGILRHVLCLYPIYHRAHFVVEAAVTQRLRHRKIRVAHSDVLADERDLHRADGFLRAAEHFLPLREVRFPCFQSEFAARHSGKIAALQHERRFVYARDGEVLYYAIRFDVAEQRYLVPRALFKRHLLPGHDDVGRYAHLPEFLDGVLRGLGLLLAGGGDVRHERDVDVKAVPAPDLAAYLPHRLQEGLALDVADGAAYLGQHHVRVRLAADRVNVILDGARDVRDDLHRFAEELSPALAVEHVPVHLARGEVGIAVEVLVDESLVMSEVEVGLRAVLGDEHFAVLVGAHRAGIDVDVRIQLLRGDFESARFQQPAQRRHDDALSEPGYYASRYKHILCHTSSTLSASRRGARKKNEKSTLSACFNG